MRDKVQRGVGEAADLMNIKQPKIEVFDTHILVGAVSVVWTDIVVISAYKLDLLTVDEIRVVITYGRDEKILELSEEQDGFERFIRVAQTYFSFPSGWMKSLVTPAFKRSEVTLFRRAPP